MQSGPNGNHTLNFHNGAGIAIRDAGHQVPGQLHGQGIRHSPDRKPGASCSVEPRLSWYIPVKRCADLLAAAVLLVLLSPFIVLGVILVKLTSRGPAFYSQVRVGKDGQEFTLFKLRTMKHNAEAETGPVWSTARDSRVTSVGKLLRSSHIDEFPQLWNVLRGQMSLVGPRPERPEFVAKLDWEVPYYRERLKVRPGITGLAQLRLEADTTLDCVRRKVEHDVYYVRHINPWLDLKLMMFTAFRLIRELNNHSWRCVVLPSTDEIGHGFHRAVGLAEFDMGVAHFPIPAAPRSALGSDPGIDEVLNAAQ
jgi:lipopolysaccharide/colanic/teichoic acid biosynthesis glycosyltransferase